LIRKKNGNLVLRTLQASDYKVWRDTFSTLPPPKNRWDSKPRKRAELKRTDFNKILRQQKQNRKRDYFYDLALFHRKSKAFLGTLSVMNVDRGLSHSAYIGYRIFQPYWGNGYGTQAVKMLLEFGFKDLKLHRLEAGVEPKNKRSIALAKRLGLRREGLKQKMVYLRGNWVDLIIYAITCDEAGFTWKGVPKNRLR
jgi:ribosomal-protein-alanine N-acetyltransferase